MNKIPFNLEDAKAGKPFASSKCFDCTEPKLYFIGIQRDGTIVSEDENGIVYLSDIKDLYMVPRTVTRYVNLYWNFAEQCVKSECNYPSYEAAIKNTMKCKTSKYVKTIEIEIEEDDEYYEN